MRKNLQMLAAILICGAMTMLTSCGVDDTPVDNNDTPAIKALTGMYAVVLDDENGTIGNNAYSMVLVAYDFKADGTGQWSELYYNDEDSYPFIGNGGDAGGQFKYTIDDEGKVLFTFERPDMALQRGTLISMDEDLIALHHAKEDAYYFGSKQDEETANEIRKLMTQFNGGSDKISFEFTPYNYGIAGYDGLNLCVLIGLDSAPAVDAAITLSKKSSGYYLEMHGGTITLDNYTGTYDSYEPVINGLDRDLTIILKGSSVISVPNGGAGIVTAGNIKLGGSGELKIITNAAAADHLGLMAVNYGGEIDNLSDLAYNNAAIKRLKKVNNENETCTWTYIVGERKTLAEVTKEDIGKPVSADGYVYPCLEDMKTFDGTLAGMLASVTATGHGLIISKKVADVSTSYEDAIAKVAAYTPAIAGCEVWHLPSDVEAAEMVWACAGVDSKPLVYKTSNLLGVKVVGTNIGGNINKLSDKCVKVGIGNVTHFIVDLNGKRAEMIWDLINRFDLDKYYNENIPIYACAKF